MYIKITYKNLIFIFYRYTFNVDNLEEVLVMFRVWKFKQMHIFLVSHKILKVRYKVILLFSYYMKNLISLIYDF